MSRNEKTDTEKVRRFGMNEIRCYSVLVSLFKVYLFQLYLKYACLLVSGLVQLGDCLVQGLLGAAGAFMFASSPATPGGSGLAF